jgi:hypothetical protein
MLIYKQLGASAQNEFAKTWGVGYALNSAAEWQDVAITAAKAALLVVLLDAMRITKDSSWFEEHGASQLSHACSRESHPLPAAPHKSVPRTSLPCLTRRLVLLPRLALRSGFREPSGGAVRRRCARLVGADAHARQAAGAPHRGLTEDRCPPAWGGTAGTDALPAHEDVRSFELGVCYLSGGLVSRQLYNYRHGACVRIALVPHNDAALRAQCAARCAATQPPSASWRERARAGMGVGIWRVCLCKSICRRDVESVDACLPERRCERCCGCPCAR